MLRLFGYPVVKCCDLLRDVGCCWINLKMVKFFMQHLWMLHDVAVVWPQVRAIIFRPGMRTSLILSTWHVATPRNRMAKRAQHVAPNIAAICCVQLMGSFGRSLQMLGQQFWDMLWWYVAIVWPGFYSQYHHGLTDQSNSTYQTLLWRWLPLRLLKSQSQATF